MKKITTFMFILLLLLSFISCELFYPTQPDVDIYGLFVGLDYKNSSINDLNGTIDDAKEMAAAFYTLADAYGTSFKGYLALQEGTSRNYDDLLYPSKTNLLERIEDIGELMDEDDLFIFYYAGHGLGSRFFDDDGSFGYLVTAPDGPTVPGVADYSTLTMSDLSGALSALSGVKVILLDSCFSGAHVAPYPLNETIDSPRYDSSLFYLTAAMEDQESWESSEYAGHGFFTYSFLNYLQWNQVGSTTIEVYTDNSIEVADSVTVTGEFSSDTLLDLPPYISLEDIASSINKLRVGTVTQEKKITSGPTNVLLFHEDW